jgi:hypothetical protein
MRAALCVRCGRYFGRLGRERVCQSCRHIELVSSGKREHGVFVKG